MMDEAIHQLFVNVSKVDVKAIFTYINRLVDTSKTNEPDLKELETILNSNSEDGLVDFATFRMNLQQWISQIENRGVRTRFLESLSEQDQLDMTNNSTDESVFSEVAVSQGDSAFSNSNFREDCEMLNDLKFKNKQLMDENVKLRGQLENQDEAVAALNEQLQQKAKQEEQMRKRIESLQDQIAQGEMVLEENEALKSKLDNLQEVKRELNLKVNNLEQENSILDTQAWGFENEWQKSLYELDLLKKDFEELQHSFMEQKHNNKLGFQESISELQTHKKCTILPAYMSAWEFSTGSTADFSLEQEKKLQEQIDGLLKENEKLKGEKEEAEIKLAESETKLQRIGEQEPTASTPLPLSIYMELKDRLDEDKHLPSPLCEKDKMFLRKSLLPISARELDFSFDTSLDNSLELIMSPLKPAELEIEKKLESLKSLGENGLQQELIKLYRFNLDLAEKCHKAELRETELEEQVKLNSHLIEKEKQKCSQLEESLRNNVNIKDLWRLVHSPEEEEDSESDSSLSASTEILKQQIKQDIEALREKLRKQDSVLQSLRKPVPRPNFRNKGRQPPSSLVDALTIDHLTIPAAGPIECPNVLSLQMECKDCNKNQVQHSQSLHHHNYIRSVPLSRKHIMETNSLYNNNVVAVKTETNSSPNSWVDREARYNRLNAIGDQRVAIGGNMKLENERKPTNMNVVKVEPDETGNGPGVFVRRNSYVNAIENEACSVGDSHQSRLRSDSFQSAIEQGQTNVSTVSHSIPLSSSVIDTTPENESSDSVHCVKVPKYASTPLPVTSKPSTKSVNFCPKVFVKEDSVDIPDEISDISNSDSLTSGENSENASVPSNSDIDEKDLSMKAGQKNHVNRASYKELSMLVEEDLPCVCCESDSELIELVSPVSEDFSPEVWTLSSSGSGCSSQSATSSCDMEEVPPVNLDTDRSEREKSVTQSTENHDREPSVGNINVAQDNKIDSNSVPVDGVVDRNHSKVGLASVVVPSHSESTQSMDELIERTRNMKISNSTCSAISDSELNLEDIEVSAKQVKHGDDISVEQNTDLSKTGAIPIPHVNLHEDVCKDSLTDIPQTHSPKGSLETSKLKNESVCNGEITGAVKEQVPTITEPITEPVIKYELKTPQKRITVRSDSDEQTGKSKFLLPPDHRNVLVPLVAISPLPSPPQSPCINFFQSKERMKGPKAGQLGVETEMTEQNNNKTENYAVDKTEGMPEEDEIPKTASYLARIRETHLAKRRDQLRQSKMPELSELSEKDGGDDVIKTATTNTESDVIQPPEPNGDILPSIPTEFLEKLGLSSDDVNSDELSDQEIESKFASLSLAFKTDAQTLEKRLEIQERSRDIAEQNVDKELQGLRTALSKLNQICTDPQVRELLSKIQNHVEILEKASARVSSRAEVFGAIQQEKRLSKAVDIMVHHVENIHRVHEKEHAELEEARKLLQDSRSLGPSAIDITGVDALSRRSASVCPNNIGLGGKSFGLGSPLSGGLTPATVKAIKLMKPRRRVSEIALPKVLGGSGAPNLHPSPSMGNITQTVQNDSSDSIGRTDKDPRSRFQAVVASTTVKSAITNNLRKASYEKQNNVPTPPPTNNETPQVSRTNSADSAKDAQDKEKQKNLEEEAFKKGYEQGMRASLGQDLSSLREQQNRINESLGDIMDNIDSNLEEPRGLREILQEKFQGNFPTIQISSWRIRTAMSCFFVVMAILSILMSLFPVNSAEVYSYRNLGHPPL